MNQSRAMVVMAVLYFVFGCGERPATQAEAPAPAGTSPTEIRLPVSLNDVMVALVNEAADPIWVAAWREPGTDAEWRQLERRAYQLQLAGSLITYPGTGSMDDKWAAKPRWRMWSERLRDVGANAIAAVEARDVVAISSVGDDIVAICEGCHIDFKLAHPTGGKFGELSPVPE